MPNLHRFYKYIASSVIFTSIFKVWKEQLSFGIIEAIRSISIRLVPIVVGRLSHKQEAEAEWQPVPDHEQHAHAHKVETNNNTESELFEDVFQVRVVEVIEKFAIRISLACIVYLHQVGL